MKIRCSSHLSLALLAVLVLAGWTVVTQAVQLSLSQALTGSSPRPLYFEANQGQFSAGIDFRMRAPTYALDINADHIYLTKRPSSGERGGLALVMRLKGVDPQAAYNAEQPQGGRVHYLKGSSPQGWLRDIPTYAAVRYQNIYPGIDVAYYGKKGRLEYDFIVAPGVDPQQIRLAFSAGESLALNEQGDLLIDYAHGRVIQKAPFIYQLLRSGQREQIDGHYVLGANGEVAFKVAAYDVQRPLIIDPVLIYGSFYGGSGDDRAMAMARDNSGNFYLTGTTTSVDYPVTSTTASGDQDVFVTKLDSAGALVYSVYIGGQQDDLARDIAVDAASGEVYVVGSTISHDFPVTGGSFDDTCNSETAADLQLYCEDGWEAFALKLTSLGALSYATYLGGAADDDGRSIAIDATGNAYVAGTTKSVDFPVTAGVFQTTIRALQGINAKDMFVVKLNSTGTTQTYSTYLGGTKDDVPEDLVVDGGGNAYITGFTSSKDYPLQNAYDASCGYDGACGATIATRRVAVAGVGGVLRTSFPDSPNWVAQASGTANNLTDLVWGLGQYVAVGAAGTIVTSVNGTAWTSRVSGTANALSGITWGGRQFVAVGTSGTILTSPDGVTWTNRSTGTSNLAAVTWSGSQYTAVGASGAVLTSPAGVTWTARTSGTTADLSDVSWDGTQFVAVGAVGTLLSSADGITWLAQASATTNNLAAVAWSGAQFVAVGAAGTILTSVDGISWISQLSGVANDLLNVAWGTNGFGVSGTAGMILLSQGGVTWTQWASGSAANLNAFAWSHSLVGADVMVTKLNATGTALTYSTYLGGEGYDFANSLFLDASNRAYIAGYTMSKELATTGVYADVVAGSDDAFVARLNAAGNSLDFLTYLGGRARDIAEDVFVDGADNIYVTGVTYSTDFPVVNGIQSRSTACAEKKLALLYACNGDIFVSRLQPAAVGVDYSFYFGGEKTDIAKALWVTAGANNQVYLAGYSNSPVFPVTNNALQATHADLDVNNAVDQSDVVFVRISDASGDLAVVMTESADPITLGENISYTITVTNNGADTVNDVVLTSQLAAGLGYVSDTGSCSEDKGVVSCALGVLAAGASVNITLIATPRQDGDYTSSASVTGRVTDTISSNNVAGAATTVNLVAATAATTAGSGAMSQLVLGLLVLMLAASLVAWPRRARL